MIREIREFFRSEQDNGIPPQKGGIRFAATREGPPPPTRPEQPLAQEAIVETTTPFS